MSIHSISEFAFDWAATDQDQGDAFAHAPFDHLDSADIIIRSSDGVHFRTVKLLLSLSSPIFKGMFSLPRSAEGIDETKDSLPIVDLTENSGTIKSLLSFCYPAVYTGKVGLDMSEISAVLEAAKKYEMEETHNSAVQCLAKPPFLEQEPLRVYAIACRHKLKEEAILAAKYTLRRPLLGDAYFPELTSIDARKLYRIQLYHKECAEAAMKVANDHTWIISADYAFFDCRGQESQDESSSYTRVLSPPSRKYKHGFQKTALVHSWWLEYMESTRVALESSSHGQTVKNLSRVGPAFAAADRCPVCRPTVAAHFQKFVEKFAAEVDNRIADVRRPLPHFVKANDVDDIAGSSTPRLLERLRMRSTIAQRVLNLVRGNDCI
jgi:hypothetical protein